ncbi:hypothetical protein D9M68_1005790 [compost metagenome]
MARGNRTLAARRIGVSRSAVSLVLVNRYPSPSTSGIERRVLETLGRLECPAQGEQVTVIQCQEFREKRAPTHNPVAMQSWRACQHCPHNPGCTTKEQRYGHH